MQRKRYWFIAAALVALLASGGAIGAQTPPAHRATGQQGGSKVYFTANLSAAGLAAVYNALGRRATGSVAVKVSTGEPPASNYLRQNLIGALVQSVKGTYVECMTAYGGRRASAAMAKQTASDHGFAPFDLLDEGGSISLPFPRGKNIKENFAGSRLSNYNFYIILSHFKGHQMGGFGGAIKNISIGMASAEGKAWIHSAGKSRKNPWGGAQNPFLESMAEAAGSVIARVGKENMLYINVMNRLSVDCDCNGSPAEPDMHDIGILASLDPVALDKACVDLVYAAPDGKSLIARIERQNGELTLYHAASLGLGSLQYELIKL